MNQFIKNTKSWKYLLIVLALQNVPNNLPAQDYSELNDIEINSSTKSNEESTTNFPTNPFELVDIIRRINSMNDATKPSDAIDDALKSFDSMKNDI
tara:strand:+ start:3040 stop:3327 length:288 start_codon:yes stop_codon:yes gene_type:complete